MSAEPRPFLWFDRDARAAMEYYTSVFPNSSIETIQEYPADSADPRLQDMAGQVLSGLFTLNGRPFGCLDGGPMFPFTEAVSFQVPCANQAEIDHYWQALSHVPDAEQCGWCKDRFGVSWQIVPERMDQLLATPGQQRALMSMKKIVIADLLSAGVGAPGDPHDQARRPSLVRPRRRAPRR